MPNAHRALLPLIALAALASAGCGGPDFDTLCQEQEDCLGGNEKDVEACIAASDGAAEEADAIGCADEFDTYFECIEPDLKCRSRTLGGACTTAADCGSSDGLTCSNGECKQKYYGLNEESTDPVCEAEQNAYAHCD